MIKFRPLKDYTLVRMAEVQETTKGGIILTGNNKTREQSCTVVSIGNDVEDVKVGDRVQIQLGDFKIIKHDSFPDDGDYAAVKEEHIIGIFE